VVLLSLIPEKKSRYLLPVLIPLAYTASFYLMYVFKAFKDHMKIGERIPIYLNFGLIGLVGVAFPIVGYLFLKEKLTGFYTPFALSAIILVMIGFFILKYVIQRKIHLAFYLIIGFLMSAITFGFPLANAFLGNPKYNSLREISAKAEAEQIPVYMFNIQSPELVWDYGGKVPLLHSHALETPAVKQFKALVMIGAKKSLENAFPNAKITYVETFDLNPIDDSKKGYKDRLRTDMYLVELE
jgi:hypothetical protein